MRLKRATAILPSPPIGMPRPGNGATVSTVPKCKMPWFCLVMAACLSMSSCRSGETRHVTDDTVPAGAQRLIDAYPEQNLRYSRNRIIFPDGASFIYDDGEQKDFTAIINEPDIEDMFSMEYEAQEKPDYLDDPGRIRCDRLFEKMYGSSSSKVYKKLVMVPWFGSEVSFTSINGAAETSDIAYANRIPMEIVSIFEKHGFIWGGRWYHFDTMHFEYRPEMTQKNVPLP